MLIQIFVIKVKTILFYILILGNLIIRVLVNSIRTTTAAFRDILLISLAVRPAWRVIVKYFFIVMVLPDFIPVRTFISSVKARAKEDSFGMISLPKTGKLKILKSERIRVLQGKIVKNLYFQWFFISCSSKDIYILSAFGNTGWLIHNLLKAAGIKKRRGIVLDRRNKRRIQTVFSAYINSLALYLKAENGRKFQSGKDVITKGIYPREIELAGLKIKKVNILSFAHEGQQQIAVNKEYISFTNYINVQPLTMEGRFQNRAEAEVLMNKLESLH